MSHVIRLLEVDEKHFFDRSKTVCLCVLLCWMVDHCGSGSLTDMKLHYGDLTDSMCLVKIISEARPTEIYNLAAQSHVKVSVWPPKTPPKPTFILKKKKKNYQWRSPFRSEFSCENCSLPFFQCYFPIYNFFCWDAEKRNGIPNKLWHD